MKNIKKIIDNEGFYLNLKTTQNELDDIKDIIFEEICNKIKTDKNIKDLDSIIGNYNNNIHEIMKNKNNRLLSEKNIERLKNINYFLRLKNNIQYSGITNEDNNCYEEIYFRIVRPNSRSDVGALHADKWFWDLNYRNNYYYDRERIKIWLPLINNYNESSFIFVPGSHLLNFNYNKEKIGNKFKPIYKIEENMILKEYYANPGEAILFHDKLVHGGLSINYFRVSLEFTMGF